MDFLAGKRTGQLVDPAVGHEMGYVAARAQFLGQRLGREQMSSRTACRDDDGPVIGTQAAHHTEAAAGCPPQSGMYVVAAGRRLVNASTSPMASATETSDEPP